MSSTLQLDVHAERWPLAEAFVISRGAKREAEVVVVTIGDGRAQGRGEAVPYTRYGEAVETVLRAIAAWRPHRDRQRLMAEMPAGAARNAIDCALWDLEAKSAGATPARIAGRAEPGRMLTCFTLSLATPEEMAAKARALARLPLLKLKLGGDGDAERMRAVRAARPDARLVADANEAWRAEDLATLLEIAAETRLELVEQPLPAGRDEVLARLPRPVPVCADESVHTLADLAELVGRYDVVNVKLDKAGGLTHALALSAEARRLGLRIMVGSMVATSLAMAPAMMLAADADWVDLDSPLLLARDRAHGLAIADGWLSPPPPALWG
jgi:L-alanine-DL-glutamate epimerase-like enolase superfamily enzyme